MPAFNVAKFLEDTVSRIPGDFWSQIHILHILNDGSMDRTGAIADSLATRNPKIQVTHFPENRGYGAVVRQGISLGLGDGSEVVICLHGDGQYAPELLPDLEAAIRARNFDLLQGSRLAQAGAMAGGMPLYKWLAGQALCFLENRVFRLSLTDYHSGYLLYSRTFLLASGFESLQGQFEIDLELIASARAKGFRVGEHPIPTRYAGETSHLNPVAYGFRVLQVLQKYCTGDYGRH
jgi:glycosyltransferase involved in cell wall biosynthesis